MKSWKRYKLIELCQTFEDGDWIESKDQSSEGIRLIQTGNVGNGKFKDRSEKARFISEETFKRLRCTEVIEGDCLVSRLPDPVGRACIIPETSDKMIAAVDCTIIRFDTTLILPEWFLYFTLSNHYQNEIIAQVSGATRQRISRKHLGSISIPLPPLPEQRRIVAILDEAFAAIDKAKANTEQNLRNARELFESYLQGVFEGSTQDWREDTLLNISTVRTGKWDANHATENGRYRFYTCAYQYAQCDTAKFSGECLILPGNGVNVGEVFYYKGEFDAYQRTYVLFDIKINPRFLHFHMLLYWRRLGTKKQYGSATNFIKMGNFEEYSVRFPSTTEQQKLVAEIEQTQLKVQELEDNYHRKLQDLEELKKSLLQKAFSGEIQIPIELA